MCPALGGQHAEPWRPANSTSLITLQSQRGLYCFTSPMPESCTVWNAETESLARQRQLYLKVHLDYCKGACIFLLSLNGARSLWRITHLPPSNRYQNLISAGTRNAYHHAFLLAAIFCMSVPFLDSYPSLRNRFCNTIYVLLSLFCSVPPNEMLGVSFQQEVFQEAPQSSVITDKLCLP